MSTEIICAIIAATGTVLSGVLSWFVSRSYAAREIEKMKLAWAREDVVSSDDEFAEMVAAVSRLLQSQHRTRWEDASAKVGAIRSKECGELASSLDKLYAAINRCGTGQLSYDLVSDFLAQVIEQKREAKRRAKTPDTSQPNH